MKLIPLVVVIAVVALGSWVWHVQNVENQKKKTEVCLKQSAEDLKKVRVGLDNKLNQQELDTVNQRFQACIKK